MYCAIRTDGTLACWGRRLYGMGEPPAGRYSALAIGGDTGCAIAEDRYRDVLGRRASADRHNRRSATAASVTVGETIAAMVAR